MENNKQKTTFIIIFIGILILGIYFLYTLKKGSSTILTDNNSATQIAQTQGKDLKAFAQCLKDKGAIFYGASWCSHCQDQKKAFGNAASTLPYVECSTPDNKDQTQICKDAKIEGYPTWVFADKSTESGNLSFEILSQKTGCQL
jgi:thiol-disulfide isomerase/thioredoxin